jgi:ABC-type transporter Mla subunit MlaD
VDVTDDELRLADMKVMERRVRERKRRDRFGRWFERLMLLVLVVLYIAGFGQTADKDTVAKFKKTDDSIARTLDQLKATNARITREAARTTRESKRTTKALCALRHGLEDQVQQTDKFLAKHPEGFAGVPAATLRANEGRQKLTIQALSNLKCPAPPGP